MNSRQILESKLGFSIRTKNCGTLRMALTREGSTVKSSNDITCAIATAFCRRCSQEQVTFLSCIAMPPKSRGSAAPKDCHLRPIISGLGASTQTTTRSSDLSQLSPGYVVDHALLNRIRLVLLFARNIGSWISLLAVAIALAGCGVERPSYDAVQASDAKIPGFDKVRLPLEGELSTFAEAGFVPTVEHAPILLSISGGGGGGAFSVGALEGWTRTGTRPTFDVVTGVSTGAFIAPFAFLGAQYDPLLRQLYTSGEAEGLIKRKFLPVALLGQSLLEQQPLRSMVERYVTPEVLMEIAREHRKGRRLLILTTNLDTQQAILWDMGAIAARATPQALSLFRDVLLASASIPGVFPAVKIKSTVNGHIIEELHSDGGSSAQFLTLPEAAFISVKSQPHDAHQSKMYVLINNTLKPEFAVTTDETLQVAARAYSIMVKSQTKSGLYAAYEFAKMNKIKFQVAAIDKSVPYTMRDPFNTTYMRVVYQIGYENAISGHLWKDAPRFEN